MVDIFISYAHQDADRVIPLVSVLESQGYSVWWDRHITPGREFEREIEDVLGECSCVILALTRHAADSAWVRAEATMAQNLGKVIPVLLEDTPIPLSLRAVQVANLVDWSGVINAEVAKLLSAVAAHAQRNANPFVGRDATMRALQASLDEMLDGHGGVVMISGEPGIGKTRCAEEFARQVEDQGALVLWGQCSEQRGAPAYWPWIQILREYLESSSEDELRAMLGNAADVVAALIPEIGERLGADLKQPRDYLESGERFRFFDSIARILAKASADLPLAIFIDDLHWADASSLALLEYLVGSIRRHRLLVVCTYRDVEVTRASPLKASLGELGRAERVSRVRLTGLDSADTHALTVAIAGIRLPDQVVDAIYQQTDGNPLFINEIAKAVAHQRQGQSGESITVDVPDGVREAIGRRLDRLSQPCNEILTVAATVGREFDAKVLAQAMQIELIDCIGELDVAAETGVIAHRSKSPTSYWFTHALIRETLYEEQQTLERLQRHRRIAEALARVHANKQAEVLSEIAHHYCEASTLGDHEVAVDYALSAASQATSVFAFEDAIRLYDQAFRVMQANGMYDDPRLARTCFNQGKLWEALGRFEASIKCHTQGIGIARDQKQGELFAEFAMALVFILSDSTLTHAVPLLEEALRLVPDQVGQRGKLKAHLAFALRSTDDLQRIQEVSAEAIELARQQADSESLPRALQLSIMAMRGFPESLPQRLEYGRELVEVGSAIANRHDRLHGLYFQLLNLVEACAIDEFTALFTRYKADATSGHTPHHEYYVMNLDIMLRLLHGEWQGLEQQIEEALAHGESIWRGAEGVYGMQMFMLNRELGRLPAMAPLVRRMVEDPNSRLWSPGLMLMCCEAGLNEAAKTAFEVLAADDFAAVPRDELWMTCMVFCAETCGFLGASDHAAALYAKLLPAAEHSANHPNGICFGSVHSYLGLLAAAMGKVDLARSHYEKAITTNRSLRAWPSLARTQLRLAELLLTDNLSADKSAGQKLLTEAEQLASRLQMIALSQGIRTRLEDGSDLLPDNLSPREIEVLKLIAIGRSNKDISTALEISLSTVATHVRNILEKTGCANRTEAAAYAMREEIN